MKMMSQLRVELFKQRSDIPSGTGFYISSDGLDRLEVVARQYEAASSSHQQQKTQSSGIFVDMTGLAHDSNTSPFHNLHTMKTTLNKSQKTLQESQKSKGSGAPTPQNSRSNSIHSAEKFLQEYYDVKPRIHSVCLESHTAGTLLSHTTNNARTHSVCLSKSGQNSNTTSEDDGHLKPLSIKPQPQPPSEHDSFSLLTKPRSCSASTVVVDHAHMQSIAEGPREARQQLGSWWYLFKTTLNKSQKTLQESQNSKGSGEPTPKNVITSK